MQAEGNDLKLHISICNIRPSIMLKGTAGPVPPALGIRPCHDLTEHLNPGLIRKMPTDLPHLTHTNFQQVTAVFWQAPLPRPGQPSFDRPLPTDSSP